MRYKVIVLPTAIRDLEHLSADMSARIIKKLRRLEGGLVGDVKRLSNHKPGWRLRVGDYRVLFDVSGDSVEVHAVRRRDQAYD